MSGFKKSFQHETDRDPMTVEKMLKLKGHEYIYLMHNCGVPLMKSHLAAVVMAVKMKEQYKTIFKGDEKVKQARLDQFDTLIRGIEAYLPMPKDHEKAESLTGAIVAVAALRVTLVKLFGENAAHEAILNALAEQIEECSKELKAQPAE